MKFNKAQGGDNPADLMTKELASGGIRRRTSFIGVEFIIGGADLAAELDALRMITIEDFKDDDLTRQKFDDEMEVE